MVYETTIPLPRKLKSVTLAGPGFANAEPMAVRLAGPHLAAPEEPDVGLRREEAELLERLHGNLEELAHELHAQQQQRLAEMQRVAIELAVAIAGRLLHQRIEAGDLAVENLIRQVAERLEASEALTVYLHPADLALLKEQGEMAEQALLAEGKLKLAVDGALNRGDCRAETGDMSLLLKLDKQLEEVRQHLLGVLPDADVERRKTQPADRQLRRFPERRHIA